MAAQSLWLTSKQPANNAAFVSSSSHRSPKLNGRVERANRTFKDEFYDCSSALPTVRDFAADLLRWEHVYNHIRPHQALDYLTPAEFLANWNATHPQEDLSRTS